MAEFDEGLWSRLVEKLVVKSKNDVTVVFKNGTEIKAEQKADGDRGTLVARLECLFVLSTGLNVVKKMCYIIIQIVLLYQCSNEVLQMLKNNIEVDVKIKCIEAGKMQAQLGEAIGTIGQYVNRIIKKGDGVMNKIFVEMLDALGYDIELHYVKKEEV